jgi:hypothetical protein
MQLYACGEECRRAANFYESLRCYEEFGLAGVESMLSVSEAQSLVILNSDTVSHPTSCCRLLTIQHIKKH